LKPWVLWSVLTLIDKKLVNFTVTRRDLIQTLYNSGRATVNQTTGIERKDQGCDSKLDDMANGSVKYESTD